MMRLDKFLRESDVGTGSAVLELIKQGRITVNGQAVMNPSFSIDEDRDEILCGGRKVEGGGRKYYMFNKPSGCITAKSDAVHKTVFDYFNEADSRGIFHVGRLDKDTEGLLLFTNDGGFNERLMRPESHVNKEYIFVALGRLNDEDIKRLEEGVSIGKDEPLTKPSVVKNVENMKYSRLAKKLMLHLDNAGHTDKYDPDVTVGSILISEGRKHQVKRMLKAVGCHIIYLKRLSVGGLSLDENLKAGEYRELSAEEVRLAMGKSGN